MLAKTAHVYRNDRCAFTLIELLVVVAVILMLIAILVPALRTGMERARSARCQSNLRQLAAAINLYVQDHNGRMPLLHRTDLENVWRHQYRQFEFLEPYIPRQSDVYQCPSATEYNSGEAFHGVQGALYCHGPVHDRVCTDYKIADNATGIQPGGSVAEPGRGVAGHPIWSFKDHGWVVVAIDLEFESTEAIHVDDFARHQGGYNVAFLAGNVKWFPEDELEGEDPYGNVWWFRWGLDPEL